MMVNLASVDEETDNEAPAESPTEASEVDETEDKVRVDRRKLEQMLQGLQFRRISVNSVIFTVRLERRSLCRRQSCINWQLTYLLCIVIL